MKILSEKLNNHFIEKFFFANMNFYSSELIIEGVKLKFLKSIIILFLITFVVQPVLAIADTVNAKESLEPIELEKPKKSRLYSVIEKTFTEKDTEKKMLEGKILKDVEFGMALQFRGAFDTITNDSSTHFKINVPVTDFWTMFYFNDERETNMKIMVNPFREEPNMSYFPGIFSDLYISTRPFKNNRILFGQSRTPIGYEGGQGQYTLLLVNRSQIARTFGNVRATGVKLTGDYKWLDYNVGVYDSARFMIDMTKGAEFTGWANLKPLANLDSEKYGSIKLGGGINVGEHDHSYFVAGGLFEYIYKNLLINFEYANANGYRGTDQDITNQKAEGFYSTIAYYIHPKIQLVGRVDAFDPNKHISNNEVQEYSLGLNYYIFKEKMKLALNYVFRNSEAGPDSNRFFILTQFII